MEGFEWFVVLGWASPIGLGIFFVCGALAVFLLNKSRKPKE